MAESLLRLTLSDDAEVAQAALQRLAVAAPEVLLEPVLKAAATGAAVPAWSRFRSPELEERLRGVLGDVPSAPARRAAAARALGALRSTASVSDLLNASGQAGLTAACLDALEAMRAPETGPAWVRLLDRHDPELQRRAVENLAALGGPSAYRAIFAIATAQRTAAPEAQAAAIDAIAAWPLSEALPALVAVLEKNTAMRAPALRALRALSGQPLGEDPAAWRAWLQNPNPDPDGDAGNARPEMPAQTDSAALPEAVQFVPPGFAPLAPGRKDN
jgi:HEAT repeat protein